MVLNKVYRQVCRIAWIFCVSLETLAGMLGGIRSTNSRKGGHWEEWGGRFGEKIVMIDRVHIYMSEASITLIVYCT